MVVVGEWLESLPLLLFGLLTFLAMTGAAFVGAAACWHRERRTARDGKDDEDNRDAYVISSVLGLLALLLGFTFSLAVDRYETRRTLVLQEANAIGTSYLYAQLLDEPHRSRMSGLLRAYAENRVELGYADSRNSAPLLARNDALLTQLWAGTAAAFDSLGTRLSRMPFPR